MTQLVHGKPRLLVLAVVLGLSAYVFADALFRSGMFAFRDGAHFYYPLFRFVAQEWAAGRVPLWDPYENLGMPLAGNAPSSVFYPGKLIFLLPIDYGWAYRLYVVGHVLLAAWTMFRLARAWQASTIAAGVAAISYAFSGNILYQYCNVIFLVGAAWLPLAVLAAERMLVGRSLRWSVAFGAVLAMITLGGDPQTAYHAGLLAALYAVWLWRSAGAANGVLLTRRVRLPRPVLLGSAALVALVLSAIQVFPSAEFTRQSGRESSGAPRSLYEIPGSILDGAKDAHRSAGHWADGLLGRIEPGTHQEHVYHFSVGPWRLAEYVWPNFGGRQFPINRRWLNAIPAEGRIWVPSLYMGVVPLALALWSMRLRRPRGSRKGRQGESAASVPPVDVTSLRTSASHSTAHTAQSSQARTAAIETMRPSQNFPHPLAGEGQGMRAGGFETTSTSGAYTRSIAAARLSAPALHAIPSRAATDAALLGTRLIWISWVVVLSVLGSFGWHGLGWLVREGHMALGQASTPEPVGPPFGGVYWLMTVILPGYVYFRYPAKLLSVAALGLSLLAARGWDRAFAERPLGLRRLLAGLTAISVAAAMLSVAVRPYWSGWLAGVRPDVLFGPLDKSGAADDLLGSLVQTALVCGLFWWVLGRAAGGKRWPLAAGLVLVAVDLAVANGWMVACGPAGEWEKTPAIATAIRQEQARRNESGPFRVYRRPVWSPASCAAAGSTTRLVDAMRWDRDTLWPKYHMAAGIPMAEVYGTMMPSDYQAFLDAARRPLEGCEGWLPDQAALDAIDAQYLILRGNDTPSGMERIDLARLGFDASQDVSLWRNPRALPRALIVHQLEPWQDGPKPGKQPCRPESCRITHCDPSRVEIEAELAAPGLVVLADQFYPGWHLNVETAGRPAREHPIVRTDRVMRGAWLPAGSHRLIYEYRPASFFWGAVLSGIGWGGLVLVSAVGAIVHGRGRWTGGAKAAKRSAPPTWTLHADQPEASPLECPQRSVR